MERLSKDNKKITIFDIQQKKVLYEAQIKGRELCGRLESGLYTLMDGYIYYSNDVIKIRYDLINKPNSVQYSEREIFDYYYDIFKLKGDRVMSKCPLNSIIFHRMVYIIKNPKKHK